MSDSFAKNNCQWGETSNLLSLVVKEVLTFLETKNKSRIEKLCYSPITATSKLDGTNLSIACSLESNNIFGRRFKIEKDQTTYIKTDLSKVRQINIDLLKQEFIRLNNIKETLIMFRINGELMCNPEFYNYKEKDYDGEFFAFGITISVDGKNEELSNRLNADGWSSKCHTYGDGTDRKYIVLSANKKLIDFLNLNSINTVPLVSSESTLPEFVEYQKESMINQTQEGYCIIMEELGYFHCSKWKIATENQITCRQQLTSLIELLTNNESIKTTLPEPLFPMLTNLQNVVCAETSEYFKVMMTRPGINPNHWIVNEELNPSDNNFIVNKLKKQVNLQLIETAWHSALSKIDLHHIFESTSSKKAIQLAYETMDCEIRNDILNEDINCYISGFLKHKIGVSFGEWKRSKCSN